jgi:hypothetical protein
MFHDFVLLHQCYSGNMHTSRLAWPFGTEDWGVHVPAEGTEESVDRSYYVDIDGVSLMPPWASALNPPLVDSSNIVDRRKVDIALIQP